MNLVGDVGKMRQVRMRVISASNNCRIWVRVWIRGYGVLRENFTAQSKSVICTAPYRPRCRLRILTLILTLTLNHIPNPKPYP